MNDMDYYVVTGGRVLQVIKEFMAKQEAATDLRRLFAARLGAVDIYGCNSRIHALGFKDQPEGWDRQFVRACGLVFCKPDARTKEGRRIIKEMRQLRLPGIFDFQDMLGFSGMIIDGTQLRTLSLESIDGVWVVGVPRLKDRDQGAKRWTPPDEFCRAIKTSEFYQMKEAAEEKQAGKAVTA